MDESIIYHDAKNPLLNLTGDANSGISPLEQEVLDEYERLLRNMNEVSSQTTKNQRRGVSKLGYIHVFGMAPYRRCYFVNIIKPLGE